MIEPSAGLPLDRRRMFQLAAVLGGGLALGERAFAAQGSPMPAASAAPSLKVPPGTIRLNGNEYWEGPVDDGLDAARAAVARSNYYDPAGERDALIETVSTMERVGADHVVPWAGSGSPLARAVVGFCGPERGLVTADPTFEVAWMVAAYVGAPVAKVPLRSPDQAHDVRAMLAANPRAGLYYVCNPNNPTGSLTPMEHIAWLVENKPKDAVVLLDEAYLHFSHAASGMDLVRNGRDVVILRTFSKIFGMAGMRMGLSIARPDLQARLMQYDGVIQTLQLPVPALACASASLRRMDQITNRREQTTQTREKTAAFLTQRGLAVLPSAANMLMVDWGKPAAPIKAAMEAKGIAIGRSWPIWPTRSRITIGSPQEMERFCASVDRVLAQA
ncbi:MULTISPECIES: pyridoxal phosphate-dependent aminotransferase [unclassified Novosphingobium]|uniref:pyridoxal phosphate-dependent aminotransferase n=1 Tax=unclassified Novosphingobium TaxID=2644732 RepID=UPI001469B8EE|nr:MULTISPECIES: pyridoxal phosphate-dependent aminotransferase [unclassified Novosphingobium]NMN04452.1 histidinol-phosphate aminotransferase [Novosphingobium sp. SG919]NMN85556.1 histidinol-phosphate aminotransferase [Novosphingobium sp. SG916]